MATTIVARVYVRTVLCAGRRPRLRRAQTAGVHRAPNIASSTSGWANGTCATLRQMLGRNRITRLHKGCVLFENYRAGGFSGSSLNTYDADRKWHQTWVDSSGGLLVIEGGLVDGKMVLAGETVDAGTAGRQGRQPHHVEPLPDGRVRQLWETSTDKGRTWTTTFDGYYAKRNSAAGSRPRGSCAGGPQLARVGASVSTIRLWLTLPTFAPDLPTRKSRSTPRSACSTVSQ